MEQRVSLITLAVADMETSRAFYRALGWREVDSPDGVIAFDLIGQTLGLYPKAALAEELGVSADHLAGSAIVLSHNVRDNSDVAPLLDRARAAGGRVIKEAQDVFWGRHHGHFADPDGHVWEIAWNPHAPLSPEGAFRWTGYP